MEPRSAGRFVARPGGVLRFSGSQRCHKGAQKACYPDEQAANDELEERAMTAAVRSLSLKIRRCRGGLAGCLAVLLAGCLALAGQPVLAQSVEDQLQRLQRELSDLQSQVYRGDTPPETAARSEEHTSDLQSLMRHL